MNALAQTHPVFNDPQAALTYRLLWCWPLTYQMLSHRTKHGLQDGVWNKRVCVLKTGASQVVEKV